MLEKVETEGLQGNRNQDLVNAYIDERYGLFECNSRLSAIAYWKERIKELEEEKAPE